MKTKKYSLNESLIGIGMTEVFYHPDPLPKMIKIGELTREGKLRVYKDSAEHEEPAREFIYNFQIEQYKKNQIEAEKAAARHAYHKDSDSNQ